MEEAPAAGGHANNKAGNPKILVGLLLDSLDSFPRSGDSSA